LGVLALLLLLLLLLVTPAAAQDWQQHWDALVAAAKREGSVVVCMSPSPPRRDYLVKQWAADFPGVALSLTVVTNGSSFIPALVTERSAGKYLWDVFHTGPASGYAALEAGLLDPLLPELILPEVRDPEVWGGWDDAFYDHDKQYMLALTSEITGPYYDARRVAPEKVARDGLKLLLDPEYKGRIAWVDPRIAGPGASYLALLDKVLGETDLRRFVLDQDPTFVANSNEAATSVIRGRSVVALSGHPEEMLNQYRAAGVKFDIRNFGNTPDRVWRGTGGATLALFKNRPHPNAARLFANWIMTRRIAQGMEEAQRQDSRRRDVPPLDPAATAIAGAHYVESQRDENDKLQRRWMAEIRKLRPQ